MTTASGKPEDGQQSSDELTREERSKKFAEGAPPIPRKAVVIAVTAFVVLGLGGAIFDHFFGGSVSTATATTTGTDPPSLETTTPRTAPTTRPTEQAVGDVPAGLVSLIGLTKLKPSTAPGFTLETKGGSSISLSSLRGKVVIVSFFDSVCNDICPVLADELRQANIDLGPDASHVVMLTINTDPASTSLSSAAKAEDSPALRSVPEWHFLTGSLDELDRVWKAYGVTIEVQTTTQVVSHNEILDFIDPEGRLRLRATPFGNESRDGTFSLAPGTEKLFASGIADTARYVLGDRANLLTATTVAGEPAGVARGGQN